MRVEIREGLTERRETQDVGFPHSYGPEASMRVELWVGITQGWWM
jgi:hypothetical protein